MLYKNKKEDISNYPNPNFRRDTWMALDGDWDFDFDDNDRGEDERWYENKKLMKRIQVPYCYQSIMSGIGDKSIHDVVWYKKSFELPSDFKGKRIILNFGACDFISKLWINGQYVGFHKGGYNAFSFDITNNIKSGENIITLRAEDNSFDCTQPRGKQSWKPDNFGCWYTRVTGIWKTVWIEAVDKCHINRVKMTPDIDNRLLNVEVFTRDLYKDTDIEVKVSYKGETINSLKTRLFGKRTLFSIDVSSDIQNSEAYYWTPEEPNLYDIHFTLKQEDEVKDVVNSYFGMRKIAAVNGKICLNNRVYYQKLILNQGYYYNALLTPSSNEIFQYDIEKIKAMGFNGIRIHQKIEDPRFLYFCDKLGLLVWAEMPSTYMFNDAGIDNIINEWRDAVAQQYNHPSIIVWTIFNESWGINEVYENIKQQSLINAVYYMIKSYDSSRLVVGNDGWEHTLTDILTVHDYVENGDVFKKVYKDKSNVVNGAPSVIYPKMAVAKGYEYNNQPVIISEFGGIAFSNTSGWGYGNKVEDEEQFLLRLEKIVYAIMGIDYICGFCYTQLTDVEQEVNGLMYENHELKFDAEKIKEILEAKGTF